MQTPTNQKFRFSYLLVVDNCTGSRIVLIVPTAECLESKGNWWSLRRSWSRRGTKSCSRTTCHQDQPEQQENMPVERDAGGRLNRDSHRCKCCFAVGGCANVVGKRKTNLKSVVRVRNVSDGGKRRFPPLLPVDSNGPCWHSTVEHRACIDTMVSNGKYW
jgi:hypothetical protein